MSTDPHDRVTARIQHVTLIMYREKFTATETQNKSAQATSIAGRLGSHHVEVCNNKELIANYYCCISRYSAKPTHSCGFQSLTRGDRSCRQTHLPKAAASS